MRQEDDEEEKTDNELEFKQNQGLFRYLCCTERIKPTNKKKDDKENGKQKLDDSYMSNDTNQGIDDDFQVNFIDPTLNKKSKIVGGKLILVDEKEDTEKKKKSILKKQSSDNSQNTDKGETEDNRDSNNFIENKKNKNGCLMI